MTSFRLFLSGCVALLLATGACAQNRYSQAQHLYSRLGFKDAVATYMPAAQRNDSEAEFHVGALHVFEADAVKIRASDYKRAKELENAAMYWFKRAQQHGNPKAAKLVNIVNANDTSVLSVSIQYIMDGTKPPPEWNFPDKKLPTKR